MPVRALYGNHVGPNTSTQGIAQYTNITGGVPAQMPGHFTIDASNVANNLATSYYDFMTHRDSSSRELSLYGGQMTRVQPPVTSRTLENVLAGTAIVVRQSIAFNFLNTEDPIRHVLPATLMAAEDCIILEPQVDGGAVIELPEHTQALEISTSERSREFSQKRYGINFRMGSYAAVEQASWAAEFNTKVAATRYLMYMNWINIGYETLFREGSSLVQSWLRRSTRGMMTGRERWVQASDIQARLTFAANKYTWFVPAVMAAVGDAVISTGQGQGGGALIMPPAVALLQHSEPVRRFFYTSGLKREDVDDTLRVPLDNTRWDPVLNVTLLVRYPRASFSQTSTSDPQVTEDPMQRRIIFSNYYTIDESVTDGANVHMRITDFRTEKWFTYARTTGQIRDYLNASLGADVVALSDTYLFEVNPDMVETISQNLRDLNYSYPLNQDYRQGTANVEVEVALLRPCFCADTLSAIYIRAPGEETGMMTYYAPTFNIAFDTPGETMLAQARMMQGCGILRKENVQIIEHLMAAGVVAGHGSKVCDDMQNYERPGLYGRGHDLVLVCKLKSTPWDDLPSDPLFVSMNLNGGPMMSVFKAAMRVGNGNVIWPTLEEVDTTDIDGAEIEAGNAPRDLGYDLSLIPYQGTVMNRAGEEVQSNTNGHLGSLDHPKEAYRINSMYAAMTTVKPKGL